MGGMFIQPGQFIMFFCAGMAAAVWYSNLGSSVLPGGCGHFRGMPVFCRKRRIARIFLLCFFPRIYDFLFGAGRQGYAMDRTWKKSVFGKMETNL